MRQTTKRKQNNFIVQGSILAIASLLSRIIGLLYRVPMTNIIGDEGMGYYNVAFQIYNLALLISSYSMPLAVSKLVAAYCVKKEYRSSYRVFKAAMVIAGLSSLVVALIIYFGADFFAGTIFKSPRSAIPLRVLAPTILIVGIIGSLRGYFQGKNTMLPTSASQLLEQIVNAFVSVYAAYTFMVANSASASIAAYGAAGGTLGTLAGACAALFFLLFVYFAYRPIIKKQIRRDTMSPVEDYPSIYKMLLLTIAPVILSQTVYQLSGILDNALFGNIMHAKGFTAEEHSALLGIYSSKYNLLVTVPVSIASAMASSIVPAIVRARVQGAFKEVKKKIHVAIKFNMIIAIPSAVGMTVLAQPILNMLFPTNDQKAAETAIRLLTLGSIAIVFYALSTISNAVLQGINRMSLPVRHSAISLGIHVVLVFVLLKFTNMGVYALVIGNITFPLVVCILNWRSIGKLLRYRQELLQSFIIPTICSFLMGILAFFSYKGVHAVVHSNAFATVVAVGIAVVAYFIFLIIFKGVTEDELEGLPKGHLIVKVAKKCHLM
ncbi:putative polysaccharide biosynthesis protein [Anaerosporobacter faecicola]|uniref:putative polysaccharide biosynthesis protein n=1 Tax=Anaerosporobacter faecicola TaxID=2718714 RepID=UPI001439DBCA|nr:polysaccharide biosynthesis protein [Anaerosporobacter faecicola]